MKLVGKICLGILEALLIIYVMVITTFLLCTNKYGYTEINGKTLISINEDNSAELTDFEIGDLIVVKKERFNSINEGDELYYYDAINFGYVIRKGNVKEKNGDSYTAVYEINDSSVATERLIGSLDKHYSKLGAVLDVLESRIGFLLIVILPVFVLFIYQIYKTVLLVKSEDGMIE